MNLNVSVKNSNFIKLLIQLQSWYFLLEHSLLEIFRNSFSYKLINGFAQKTKVSFRYSFLGRISKVDGDINMVAIKESFLAHFLINLFVRTKQRIGICFTTSEIFGWIRGPGRDLEINAPFKKIGIIIILAILVNIIFSVFFKVKIDSLGWVIRFIFLFLGISGLFCNSNWQDIKKTSFIFRQRN